MLQNRYFVYCFVRHKYIIHGTQCQLASCANESRSHLILITRVTRYEMYEMYEDSSARLASTLSALLDI